jgi:predicted methyltransferase
VGVRAKFGDRVLDLCCGSGDLAFLLSEKVGSNGKVCSNFQHYRCCEFYAVVQCCNVILFVLIVFGIMIFR